ncbi:Rieske 2Fe-2S domain-containing protein [Crenobacter caeni]|uniref:Rieske 2Fe-2S domain-containing protein n=1 Tax=Crenobacter caeni TaxID=2705474 RepID=A0A6B2KUW0_9NEIS|nr:Rieske 2Fe-2S domain-containing protein [Crenobacter caeni]NDV13793.1 Rieske 2Fe-2S domain-containing protein [Crenobacter caeni]
MTNLSIAPDLPVFKSELPTRYARGWHCIGVAADYRDGKPHTLDAFGTRLAVFADSQGKINVLDAYCPHMGADLSHGTIEGDLLVCPFHQWRFGADGKCQEIPYCKRVPVKAKTRKWLTCEENGLLFVWHNAEGRAPAEGVVIPHLPELDSDEWSDDWMLDTLLIETNPRELVDNLVDAQHFGPVHGAPTKYFANVFEGHVAHQCFHGDSERLGGDLVAESAYYGPAVHFTRMRANYDGRLMECILLNANTPITQTSFQLRFGVRVKKQPDWTEAQNLEAARGYVMQNRESFYQDVAIWKNKIRVNNPVLAEGDGPVYQLREWYEQFFTDEDAVPAKLKERVEIVTWDRR